MKTLHKVCTLLLLLVAASFQANAADFPNHLKSASQLTPYAYEKAKPNVLLCILQFSPESGISGDIIGRVIPGHKARTYLCEYILPEHGFFSTSLTTTEFHWLDVTHGELASWLTSFASIEKDSHGKTFFAIRGDEHDPEHFPPICVHTTAKKGFEFGYETVSEEGQKSCDHFVGAIYPSPFFNFVEITTNGCTGDTFSPECHQCNGDGCGAFHCSAFTTWDKCPKGSHQCDYEVCASHFCTNKPICEWDK